MRLFVSKIDILPLRAPLIYPFRTAFGQHDDLENILVRIKLDNGTAGFGEAAIAPHITGETVRRTIKNLKQISEMLIGRNVREYERVVDWLHERLADNKAAVAALEMAILDAATRSRGIPLWRLFGRTAQRITTDITLVIAGLNETQAAAGKFYRQGFRAFKVKIGRNRDLDFQRVLGMKKVAPRSQILLDANQGYTAKQTIELLKELAKCNIRPALIEQPVARDDLEGLKEIKLSGLAPVCADESVRTLADCREIIRQKAADIINIKLMKTGFLESQKIIKLAKARGLKLMIGGMMESTLAMTAAAHWAAGLKCFDFIDLDCPFFIKGKWGRSPYLDSRGNYDVRRKGKAGIGIDMGRI